MADDDELGSNTGSADPDKHAVDGNGDAKHPEVIATPKSKRSPKPKGSERVRIQLEESDEIPPNGLFLGLNGKGHILRPGEPADVPLGIVDILEHAVMSVPVVEPQTKQVIGYRDRLRYPFRKL